MAEDRRMTASQVVDKLMASEHADVLRQSVAWVLAELMEAEVSTQIGAELGERAPGERTSQRNGYRPRNWSTRAGEVELAIRDCAPAATSRASSSRASARSGRSSPSCRRPTSTECRPARSTASSSSSASPACRKIRSRACARASTTRSRPFASARSRAATPTFGSTPRSSACASRGEADQGRVVGEDADDVRAPADLAVDALERVGRAQLRPSARGGRRRRPGRRARASSSRRATFGAGSPRRSTTSARRSEASAPEAAAKTWRIAVAINGLLGLCDVAEHVAQEVHRAALPGNPEHLGDGGLEARVGV